LIEQGLDSQVPPLYLEIWAQFAGNRKALRTEVERIKLKYSGHELERDGTYSWAELGEPYGSEEAETPRAAEALTAQDRNGVTSTPNLVFDSFGVYICFWRRERHKDSGGQCHEFQTR